MKILIDTNVIIDVLNKRKDFFEDSFNALQIVFKKHQPCVSAQTVADTVYITRKTFQNSEHQKKHRGKLLCKLQNSFCDKKADKTGVQFSNGRF